MYLGKSSVGIIACPGAWELRAPHEGFSRSLGAQTRNKSKQWPLAEESNKRCTHVSTTRFTCSAESRCNGFPCRGRAYPRRGNDFSGLENDHSGYELRRNGSANSFREIHCIVAIVESAPTGGSSLGGHLDRQLAIGPPSRQDFVARIWQMLHQVNIRTAPRGAACKESAAQNGPVIPSTSSMVQVGRELLAVKLPHNKIFTH